MAEKYVSVPVYKMCRSCADKLANARYAVIELESYDKPMQCELCRNMCYLSKYKFQKIQESYKRSSGGGERARAGR